MAHTLHKYLRLLGLCLPLAGCATLDSVLSPHDPDLALPDPVVLQLPATACDRSATVPDQYDPYVPAGVTRVKWEDMDGETTIAACLRALADHPGHPRLLTLLAQGYRKAGRNEEAHETIKTAARQNYPYALYL